MTPNTEPDKTPFHHADLGFLAAMCETFAAGVKHDRAPGDWKRLPWPASREEYVAKVLRHLRDYTEATTPEERAAHAAAIGCNANILWHHEQEARQ
jgi:hypothetical protein